MVDIKELMRTYVFLNDPNVKEITTKFGALLVALGAIGALVYGAVSLADDPAVADQDPSAAEAGDAGGYENRECMDESDLTIWKQDHQAVVLSGDYEVRTVDTNYVCVEW